MKETSVEREVSRFCLLVITCVVVSIGVVSGLCGLFGA